MIFIKIQESGILTYLILRSLSINQEWFKLVGCLDLKALFLQETSSGYEVSSMFEKFEILRQLFTMSRLRLHRRVYTLAIPPAVKELTIYCDRERDRSMIS